MYFLDISMGEWVWNKLDKTTQTGVTRYLMKKQKIRNNYIVYRGKLSIGNTEFSGSILYFFMSFSQVWFPARNNSPCLISTFS